MDNLELEKKDTINLVIKQDSDQSSEISLKDIIGILKNGKRFIALFTAAVFILSLISVSVYSCFMTTSSGSVRALLSFNYDGIEKGLDLHGKVFDIDKVKAPVVIDKVMDSLDLYSCGLTTEDIRKNINIEGVIPEDIINKVITINKMAEKDVTKLEELNSLDYHPTQFLVTLNVARNLGFNSQEAKRVLNEVLNEYRKYFFDTYSDTDVLSSTVGELNYDEYDYPEVARVLKGQISIINSYLSDKQKKSPDFRSKTTQMSFGDIISYLNILSDVDITRMSSLIFSYNLTKDKGRLLSLYQYRIEQNQVDMSKQKDEFQMAKDSVNKYQKNKNLVIVPGTDGDTTGSLEFDQTNQYYDQLTERALNAGIAASDYSRDFDYYKMALEKLKSDTVPDGVKQKYTKEVNSMMTGISDKLKNWVDITNKTVAEYYETEVFTNAVKIPVPAEYQSQMAANIKKLGLVVIAATLAATFISSLLVFLRRAASTDTDHAA